MVFVVILFYRSEGKKDKTYISYRLFCFLWHVYASEHAHVYIYEAYKPLTTGVIHYMDLVYSMISGYILKLVIHSLTAYAID